MSSTAAPEAGGSGRPSPGRRIVLEPTPPGFWALLLGASVAALAPLGGFLIGGAIGVSDSPTADDPMFLALFLGMVVGGIGVLAAILGGRRLWRHLHRKEVAGEVRVRRVRTTPSGDPEA